MSSSFEEAILRDNGPLLAASRAAALPKVDRERVDGLAFLVSKNKQLSGMSTDKAIKEFEKLDRDVQQSLKAYFPDEKYFGEEEQGILGNAWEAVRNFGDKALDTLSDYGQKITTPYRVARIAATPEDFFKKKTWQTAKDGNRIFEADREKEIEQFYDPNVRNIAKRIAIGESFSKILSTLETEEEFNTFRRWMDGDEEIKRAVADYDMAKISMGRDIAKVFFDVKVGEFGTERRAFDLVSGSFDAISQVAFDPLTYVAAPFKAMQAAKYGTLRLTQLEDAQFAKSIADYMANPKAQEFWNTFGRLATDTLSPDKATKRRAWEELRNYAPDFDKNTVMAIRDTVLKDIKSDVFDANAAREFLSQSENVENIMRGSVGTMERLLPRHTATRVFRNKLTEATKRVTGYNKVKAAAEEKIDDLLETLKKEGNIEDFEQVKQMTTRMDKFARSFERALISTKLYIGGVDERGNSLRAQSSQDVFSLARAVGLSKFHSSAIADAYAVTDEQGARNIIYGLFDAAGQASGLSRTQNGRLWMENLRKTLDEDYAEEIVVDETVRKLKNLPEDVKFINPAKVNGNAHALHDKQVGIAKQIPSLHEIQRITSNGKFSMLRSLDSVFNNHVSQSVTNYWSAFTLLPRLGYRTVLDENLFHYMSIPFQVATNLFKGRKASVTLRSIEGGQELTIGTRQLQKFIGEVTPQERVALQSDPEKMFQFIEKRFTQGAVRDADGTTSRHLAEFAVHRGSQEVQYLHDAVTNTAYGTPVMTEQGVVFHELPVKIKDAMKEVGLKLEGPFTRIRQSDPSYILSLQIQLDTRLKNKYSDIALRYIDQPELAVDEMYKAMAADAAYTSQFVQGANVREFAVNQYLSIRNLFLSRDGSLNTKLLDEVRKFEVGKDGIEQMIIKSDVDYDVLDDMKDLLPSEVFGRMGKFVSEEKNRTGILAQLIEVGFKIADRQVAMLSREPVFYAYYLGFRKKLDVAENRHIKKLIEQGMTEDAARLTASKRYTALASEMAYNRILGYIDNPLQRTNLAFANRNSARYYRATEDFYRRVGRTVVNSPDALVRLRMASEGMDHAGFIHEDENGERYFFLPVDSIMYTAYAPIVKAITGEWPKKPMPIRLSGKVKMLTPSLDPEAALPSFSGPLMAVGLGTIERLVPLEYREGFTRALLGPYAENASLYQQVMPGTIRRMIEVAKAMDPVGTSEQVHSAALKAAAFYAANGMAPGADADLQEREEFSRNVQATARNIVAIRNILGIFSPVAPQVMTNADVPEHLLEEGTLSFKAEFNNLVNEEAAKGNPNAYDDALRKFTKLNPGMLVYKVSESEMNKIASIKKTREAADWIKANPELLRRHPQGAAFLVPSSGEFDIEAYSFLKREGFIKLRAMDDFFREVSIVQAENEYYDRKRQYQDNMATIMSDSARSFERRRWEEWSRSYKEANPYLRLELENFDGLQFKRDALQDLRSLLQSNIVPQDVTTRTLSQMIAIYDKAESTLSSITGQTDEESRYRASIRNKALSDLERIAAKNPNASSLYNTVLRRLLGD